MGWYWWVQAASRMAMARVMRVLSLGWGGGRSRRSGMGAPSHHGTASGRSRAGRGRPGTRGSGPRGGAVGLRMPAASWSGAFRGGGGDITVPAHGAPRARDLTGVRGAEAAIDGAGGGGDPEARLGRVASPGPDAADTGIVGVSAHLRPRSRGRERGAGGQDRLTPVGPVVRIRGRAIGETRKMP